MLRRIVSDLSMNIKVNICPIVREADGLAMSSRNKYLDAEERVVSLVLYNALSYGKTLYQNGERDPSVIISRYGIIYKINNSVTSIINEKDDVICDYISIDSMTDAMPITTHITTEEALLSGAIFIGKTRLIDNMILSPN